MSEYKDPRDTDPPVPPETPSNSSPTVFAPKVEKAAPDAADSAPKAQWEEPLPPDEVPPVSSDTPKEKAKMNDYVPPAVPPVEEKKSNKTLWIILIVVLVLLCCCCVVVPLVVFSTGMMDFDQLMNEFSRVAPLLALI